MKLKNLIQARNVLFQHKNDKVPSALAYKLMKFVKTSDSDEVFYNEKIQSVLEECALRDENGKMKVLENGNIVLQPAKADEFHKQLEEIQNLEVEKPNFEFTINELEPLSFSMTEIESLDEFII